MDQLIKALGDKGELIYCEKVVDLMRNIGMRLSVVTYGTLISRAGAWKKVSLAERFFEEMMRYVFLVFKALLINCIQLLDTHLLQYPLFVCELKLNCIVRKKKQVKFVIL